MIAILSLIILLIAYNFIAIEKFNCVEIALFGASVMVIVAFGAVFGGIDTIIGASAKVTPINLSRNSGNHISFWQFGKYDIPVTFLSVILVFL